VFDVSDGFYLAFENRFRGSRELIKDRLRVYLAFLEPIREFYPDLSVIDLGCGRGEWLELLQENSIQATGVDLDSSMLYACQRLGLSALHGDAIKTLKALPDESRVIVSAFHVAEHLPFEALQTLVSESIRVLKPGGLLILETPNPESLAVSTVNFYLDPTHQRPIPPLLLSFLPEHYGFARVKTLRLQEWNESLQRKSLTLCDLIFGTSRDFAVIAQKKAEERIMDPLNPAFAADYGLSLELVVARYDEENRLRNTQIEATLRQFELSVRQAEERARQADLRLDALLSSSSWRITRPLRWLARQLKSFIP
jgi:SAM-dependent methyltransferase